jgi:hypothetical protein
MIKNYVISMFKRARFYIFLLFFLYFYNIKSIFYNFSRYIIIIIIISFYHQILSFIELLLILKYIIYMYMQSEAYRGLNIVIGTKIT